MLDKQQDDKNNETRQREKRAQDFMNRMADNVLSKMNEKQKHEDEMLMKYENEREMKMRRLEERRAQRQKEEQQRMRDFLSKQVAEKRERERNDKENIDQQAQMWSLDKKNYEEEEKRLRDRIGQINKDNASFLLRQMEEKTKKNYRMSNNEFAINKPLLREANNKLKDASVHSRIATAEQEERSV